MSSGRRGLVAGALFIVWLACVWYGFVRYGQLNPEPLGLGPFLAGAIVFLIWQLAAVLPAAALWFLVRRLPWRSWWSIARLPLIVSGGGWLLLIVMVLVLRLSAVAPQS